MRSSDQSSEKGIYNLRDNNKQQPKEMQDSANRCLSYPRSAFSLRSVLEVHTYTHAMFCSDDEPSDNKGARL